MLIFSSQDWQMLTDSLLMMIRSCSFVDDYVPDVEWPVPDVDNAVTDDDSCD